MIHAGKREEEEENTQSMLVLMSLLSLQVF